MGSLLGKIREETPKYEVKSKGEGYEVREYGACTIAEVTYDPTEMKNGRDGGFSILADYIGVLKAPQNKKVGATEGEKVAMTAPVVTKEEANMTSMSFFLPSKYSADNAPVPLDPRVKVKQVPPTVYGVTTFNGVANSMTVDAKAGDFKKLLVQAGFQVIGNYILARYNPPWTPPPLRTNEIMFPLQL